MKKQTLWRVAVVVLAVALVAQYAYNYYNISNTIVVHAAWPQKRDFKDIVDTADTVVEADVLRVEAGPDTVLRLEDPRDEPGGVDRIPSQRVTVRVRSKDKGRPEPGQELVIHRAGGEVRFPEPPQRGQTRGADKPQNLGAPPGAQGDQKGDPNAAAPNQPPAERDPNAPGNVQVKLLTMEGDPAYAVGDRVFLALVDRPNEPNVKQPVHPAGRYKVRPNGTLEAVADDDISNGVNGRQLAEAKRAARGEINIPNRPGVGRRVAGDEGVPGMPRTGGHSLFEELNPGLFIWLGIGFVISGLMIGLVSFVPRRRRGH